MIVNARGVACVLGMVIAIVAAAEAKSLANGAPAQSAAPSKPAAAPLPAKVKAAFSDAYPQATVTEVMHEKVHGQEQYEIDGVDHGLKLHVNYKPDGSVIVIEQEVAAADVPAEVTAAIKTRYPQATLTLYERATEKKSTYYDIGLTGAAVDSVRLTPDGKWVSPKLGK